MDVADVSTVDVNERLKELLEDTVDDSVDVIVRLARLLGDVIELSIVVLKVADIENVDVMLVCAVVTDEVASSGIDDEDIDETTCRVLETTVVDVRLFAGCPASHDGIVEDIR